MITTSPNVFIQGSRTGLRIIHSLLSFLRSKGPYGPEWKLKAGLDALGTMKFQSYLSLESSPSAKPWFVLRSPVGSKEVCISHCSSNDNAWEILYSPSAGFLGGTATTRASAEDEVRVVGEDEEIFLEGTQIWQFAADDNAASWFCFGYESSDFSSVRGGLALLPLFPFGGTDPVIVCVQTGTSGWTAESLGTEGSLEEVSGPRCCGLLEDGAEVIPAVTLSTPFGTRVAPGHVPKNADEECLLPIAFLRHTGLQNSGFKGVSSFIFWNPTGLPTGRTLDGHRWIVVGDVVFPWDGTSVPTIM